MTTSFPETKEDFTAENGVTYTWDVNRWRTKAYKLDESKFEEYLPVAGGTMEGQLHLQIEPEWEDSATSKSYVDNLAATNLALVWAQNYATEEYVDNAIGDIDLGDGLNLEELDQRYFKTTGGTVDGLTTITFGDAPADNSYVFNVVGPRLPEGQTSAFRVTAGGSVKAGHDTTSPFIARAANDVVTKAYADIEYALSMKRFGNNDVATGEEGQENVWRIRGIRENGNRFTAMSINGEGVFLYNLNDPLEPAHAANRRYVDAAIADISLDGYLPLTGGTITGELKVAAVPQSNPVVANKKYVDDTSVKIYQDIARIESAVTERQWTIQRSSTPAEQAVSFYEANGFFYYFIDVRPKQGRVIGNPANFGFKDCALPFKIGWIQNNGAENIMVSAVATLVRKTTSGSGHYFQVAVDPDRDDALIHDPYTVPQGSTVVVTLAGLV